MRSAHSWKDRWSEGDGPFDLQYPCSCSRSFMRCFYRPPGTRILRSELAPRRVAEGSSVAIGPACPGNNWGSAKTSQDSTDPRTHVHAASRSPFRLPSQKDRVSVQGISPAAPKPLVRRCPTALESAKRPWHRNQKPFLQIGDTTLALRCRLETAPSPGQTHARRCSVCAKTPQHVKNLRQSFVY